MYLTNSLCSRCGGSDPNCIVCGPPDTRSENEQASDAAYFRHLADKYEPNRDLWRNYAPRHPLRGSHTLLEGNTP